MTPETIAFIQWLVNQGVGVAIALLILWRLDQRMAAIERDLELLIRQETMLLEAFAAHNGLPPTPRV